MSIGFENVNPFEAIFRVQRGQDSSFHGDQFHVFIRPYIEHDVFVCSHVDQYRGNVYLPLVPVNIALQYAGIASLSLSLSLPLSLAPSNDHR